MAVFQGTALLGEHIPVKVQNFSASELHTYLLLLRETDNFHKGNLYLIILMVLMTTFLFYIELQIIPEQLL